MLTGAWLHLTEGQMQALQYTVDQAPERTEPQRSSKEIAWKALRTQTIVALGLDTDTADELALETVGRPVAGAAFELIAAPPEVHR